MSAPTPTGASRRPAGGQAPRPGRKTATATVAGSRWLMRLLHAAPAPLGEQILVASALAQGLASPRRRRRAYRWAASQPGHQADWPRLARAILANRGRFLALRAQIGVRDPVHFLRSRVVPEGLSHLEAARRESGALLVGFHLGPDTACVVLRLLGYPVIATGRGRPGFIWPDAPAPWTVKNDENCVVWSDRTTRVAALHRLRRRLLEGRLVYMTIDGKGHEAFRIPLPGGAMVVRAGWLTLRRMAGAAALPLTEHYRGGRLHLRVHPPLPRPLPDPAADLEAVRRALTPVVTAYVRDHPEECYTLALVPPEPA